MPLLHQGIFTAKATSHTNRSTGSMELVIKRNLSFFILTGALIIKTLLKTHDHYTNAHLEALWWLVCKLDGVLQQGDGEGTLQAWGRLG
jgi:hypothetical protein